MLETKNGGERASRTATVGEMFAAGNKVGLLGNVGEGKSFWITELVKGLCVSNDRTVRFFEARELAMKPENEIVTIFRTAAEENEVLCIDAVDETAGMARQAFLKHQIREFSGRCVFTARRTEYGPDEEWFAAASLKPLDMETFIATRFSTDPQGRITMERLVQEHFITESDESLAGNPLILTLVSTLVKACPNDEKEQLAYLGGLRNRATLYEKAVGAILGAHSKGAKGQAYDREEDVRDWTDKLKSYAFDLFSGNPRRERRNYFDAHLGVLFHRSEECGYAFVHESFYEYFLAAHFVERNGDVFQEKSIVPLGLSKNARRFYLEIVFSKNPHSPHIYPYIEALQDYATAFKRYVYGQFFEEMPQKSILDFYMAEGSLQSLNVIVPLLEGCKKIGGGRSLWLH